MSQRPHALRGALAALAASLVMPLSLGAQGALSNQGLGYPTGQLSASALGTGGATAESDPSSPINPAAITQGTRFAISFQVEPEFRTTEVDSRSVYGSVIRFPTFQATGSWRRFTGSLSVSNFLDRAWQNRYSDSLLIGGDWVQSEASTSVRGSISDVRAALGYVVSPRLQLGVGLHSIGGNNRTEFSRVFPPTSGVGNLGQQSSLAFAGSAVSLGVVAIPADELVLAASFRSGGEMRIEENGVETATATVPQRFGVGVSWLAVPGAWFSGRVERVRWSDLDALGTGGLVTFDATEYSLGTEVLGPRIGGANSVVRAGLRDRTLPFGILGDQVRERAFSFGGGVPLARGRAQFDFAVQRASRTALGADERGWFLSLGFGIRP